MLDWLLEDLPAGKTGGKAGWSKREANINYDVTCNLVTKQTLRLINQARNKHCARKLAIIALTLIAQGRTLTAERYLT